MQYIQRPAYIRVNADCLVRNIVRANRFSEVYGGINRVRVFGGHFPERIFDDSGGVETYSKL
jgi:hypothetical protein